MEMVSNYNLTEITSNFHNLFASVGAAKKPKKLRTKKTPAQRRNTRRHPEDPAGQGPVQSTFEYENMGGRYRNGRWVGPVSPITGLSRQR